MKIVAVTNKDGQSISLDELKYVICRVEPSISVEEVAAVESGMKRRVLPWFSIADGPIQLEQSDSRWFLGGRIIESCECR